MKITFCVYIGKLNCRIVGIVGMIVFSDCVADFLGIIKLDACTRYSIMPVSTFPHLLYHEILQCNWLGFDAIRMKGVSVGIKRRAGLSLVTYLRVFFGVTHIDRICTHFEVILSGGLGTNLPFRMEVWRGSGFRDADGCRFRGLRGVARLDV